MARKQDAPKARPVTAEDLITLGLALGDAAELEEAEEEESDAEG